MNCWNDRAILELAKTQIESKTYEARRAMDELRERLDILEDLEHGELNVDETIRRLEQMAGRKAKSGSRKQWWVWPLSMGGVLAIAGVLLSIQGGWFWLAALPALLVGAGMLVFGLASIGAPVIDLRVDLGSGRAIALKLPVPLRWARGLLRRFGSHLPALDESALDEILLSMQELDQPLTIEVDPGTSGERVHLYFG